MFSESTYMYLFPTELRAREGGDDQDLDGISCTLFGRICCSLQRVDKMASELGDDVTTLVESRAGNFNRAR